MDPNCNNPLLSFINCHKFGESWSKLLTVVPSGPSGNAYPKLNPPPYGVTPLATPKIPYEPLTSSITRGSWEGWRFGSNYMHTDGIERPYGFPDYQYYRGNYCGPCCPCVAGTNPPLLGDPQGHNRNIRYVQLDFKNLLGSGFATQGIPPTSQNSPYAFTTACGKDHCMECSGVYKKKQQPVKFQVCIGDQRKLQTVQPCPVQPMKVYLPLSVIPRCGPDGDNNDQDANNCEDNKQLFEVYVPGQKLAYMQQGKSKMDKPKMKGPFDPCGTCNACNNSNITRKTPNDQVISTNC